MVSGLAVPFRAVFLKLTFFLTLYLHKGLIRLFSETAAESIVEIMTTLSATVDLMTSRCSDQWKVDVISGKCNHAYKLLCNITS